MSILTLNVGFILSGLFSVLFWSILGLLTSAVAVNQFISIFFFELPATLMLSRKGWLISRQPYGAYLICLLITVILSAASYHYALNYANQYFFCYVAGVLMFATLGAWDLLDVGNNLKTFLELNRPHISAHALTYLMNKYCVKFSENMAFSASSSSSDRGWKIGLLKVQLGRFIF